MCVSEGDSVRERGRERGREREGAREREREREIEWKSNTTKEDEAICAFLGSI